MESFSDTISFLRPVPRWVWIVLLIATVVIRLTFGLAIFIIFIILCAISIVCFREIVDDTGPGHIGNKPGILEWLKR